MTFKLLSMIGAAGIAMITSSCVVPSGHVSAVGVGNNYSASVGLQALPYGYQTHHVGGIPYFFYNNYWYAQRSGRYYRTGAPKGYSNYRSNRSYGTSYNSYRGNNKRVYGGNNNNVRRNNAYNRSNSSNGTNRSNLINRTREDLRGNSSNNVNRGASSRNNVSTSSQIRSSRSGNFSNRTRSTSGRSSNSRSSNRRSF